MPKKEKESDKMAYTDSKGVILNKGLTIAQYNSKVASGEISSTSISNELFDLVDDLPVSQTEKDSWNAKSEFSGDYDDLTNKPTIPTVPTNLGDFNNDVGFIVNTVNNLTNYYKKDDTYTKTEVNNLISGVSTMNVSVVSTLPATGNATTIYLVPKTTSETQNIYDEYLYVNSKWEKIGDTKIDLTNYALKSELPTKTSDLTNDSDFVTDSSYVHTDNNYSNTEKDKVTANTNARHTHTNKTVLDATTASFTTALKTKLDGVETGAKANVIESVKVNGTALSISNKSVDIEVPTAITRIWS